MRGAVCVGCRKRFKPSTIRALHIALNSSFAISGIAGAATGLNEMAGQLQGLVSYADSLKTIFLIVAIGGIALAAYARFKDQKDGVDV